MVLHKVSILIWFHNSIIVMDHSRIVKGIFQFYLLDRCPVQSRNISNKVRMSQFVHAQS